MGGEEEEKKLEEKEDSRQTTLIAIIWSMLDKWKRNSDSFLNTWLAFTKTVSNDGGRRAKRSEWNCMTTRTLQNESRVERGKREERE